MDRGKGKNWLELRERVTHAYNADRHGSIDAAPNSIPDSVTFEQRRIAAESATHNDQEIRARRTKLEKLGGFRSLRPKKRGMKTRADESTWGNRVHKVKDFPQAAVVRDEDNNEFATKRVLAVPLDSTTLTESTTLRDRLQPYAEDLRELVADGPGRYSRLAETLETTRPGLANILRNANLTTKAFTAMFPDLITRRGWEISAT